ncbi:MFS transporter [Scopulibacillus cellulosilyticus]|uniref:MFS transporter n=1 Tax=Scopulibacillus cellulosilyticus TaxID=2665665 RepID=A0ABW2Q0M1_9BACL
MSTQYQKQQQAAVVDRMNRLPMSKYFLKFVAKLSIGGFFEFYELFLVGSIGAALIDEKLLTTGSMAYFVGAGFLGMFFGTLIFGYVSDKVGRRNGYIYSLLIYSIFTICMAFAPSAVWLDIFRLCAGFGVGAQLVIIDTYITEMTPSSKRGFYIAYSQFITFWAVPIVTLLAYLLVPTHFLMDGWRWVVLIGGLGAVFVWWIRLGLPESPRWQEQHGQIDKADQTMKHLEKMIEQEVGLLPPVQHKEVKAEEKGKFSEIWKPPYRSRTIMLLVFNLFQTIGFYGFASWVPTLLVSEGITLVHSLFYTFIMALANPFGPILGMLTSDRLERKWMIVVISIAIAVAGTIFSLTRIPSLIILMGIIITLLNNWFSTLFHSYQAELYPTRIRATGVGFTYGWSRLSSVFSGFIIAGLLHEFGVVGVFGFISVAMLIVAISIGGFGPKTNKKELEEI